MSSVILVNEFFERANLYNALCASRCNMNINGSFLASFQFKVNKSLCRNSIKETNICLIIKNLFKKPPVWIGQLSKRIT